MTRNLGLITVLLISLVGADNNMAPMEAAAAVPVVPVKTDNSLRGVAPIVNAAEKIHAPPDWHPPSSLSAAAAWGALLGIPVFGLIGMVIAKDNGGKGPCILFSIPVLILFVYEAVVTIDIMAFGRED